MSRWPAAIVAAAISAWACGVAVQYATPVDHALPAIAVILTAVAAVTFPAMQLAVPLLIGGEIAIPDERLRLLWFGLVIGLSVAAAALGGPAAEGGRRSTVLTISAILLLRWIPLRNVLVVRELVLIAIALAIVAAMRWSTLGVAIAVAAALFTPAVPLRTLAFPIIVLLVCVAARFSASAGALKRAATLGSFALCVMLLFFAWSGVFARALPLALRGLPRATPRAPVRMALAPGQSVTLDVPPDAGAVIVSGANVSRLKRGTVAGSVGATPVRIGDIADWGFLRREHFYASRNVLPADPAGELRDYGQCAWVDGAARFAIPPNARTVRVTADPRLPPTARLQIDAFELVPR